MATLGNFFILMIDNLYMISILETWENNAFEPTVNLYHFSIYFWPPE